MTTIEYLRSSSSARQKKCDHEWHPVELRCRVGWGLPDTMYVACPKCGAYKLIPAHHERDDQVWREWPKT